MAGPDQPDPLAPFDMDGFVERYVKGFVAGAKAAATMQAAELGHAFSTIQIRMDAQFAFVREVLKEAHPVAYNKVLERNGNKPSEDSEPEGPAYPFDND